MSDNVVQDPNNFNVDAEFTVETNSAGINTDMTLTESVPVNIMVNIDVPPYKTSQLVNDGEDGTSPYITESEVTEQLENIQEQLDNKITDVNTTENSVLNITKDGATVTIVSTTFVYEQGVASDTWVIEHNLNKKPMIEVVDSADTVINIFQKSYDGPNKVILQFNGAFKGKAYLN